MRIPGPYCTGRHLTLGYQVTLFTIRPYLIPPGTRLRTSLFLAPSRLHILSLYRYRCWPTRLCHPNGPGLGRVWIPLAPMYLPGLLSFSLSILRVRQIHSSLGCLFGMCLAFTCSVENDTKLMALEILALLLQDNSRFYVFLVVSFKR